MTITPGEIKTAQLHGLLLASIAPRPICFASTMDAEGVPNLSPFSFFNIFGSNPVTLIFSPARRVRDNTLKHTLHNAMSTKEVVINVVNYAMVQQMSLSSCEYPEGTNEFTKAGFTMLASELVKPYRVAESPVQLECIVKQVIETGSEGGAGNLVICEMVKMHINDNVLNENGQIDPNKIDLVARMGADYYCRASGDAVFEVPKPNTQLGIGFDALPKSIAESNILSGNDLARLANVHLLPIIDNTKVAMPIPIKEAHIKAKELIAQNDIDAAWQILLLSE
jgi:flavin reductase (DIM6/NTAB) family NADH-FMN oxidoreductase RutF